MTNWRELSPGPELRRIIAERLGWHMRKVWVGSGGVEYDYIVYDDADRFVYQREMTKGDLIDEQAATDAVWREAVESDESPHWDSNDNDAMWLIVNGEYKLWQTGDTHHAWVESADFSGSGPTEALAIVRAWLAYMEIQSD